jgi:hypothetical protein
MYPHLFTIGDFTVTSFGLMMFLSFVVGAWVLARQFEKRGLDPEAAWDMLLWIALGGIVGAKLYYTALHYEALLEDPIRELTNRGGLVWYGGFIGGVAAFYWQVRKRGLPLGQAFDAGAGPGHCLRHRPDGLLPGGRRLRAAHGLLGGHRVPGGVPAQHGGVLPVHRDPDPGRDPGHGRPGRAPHPALRDRPGAGHVRHPLAPVGAAPDGRLFALYLAMYGVLRFGSSSCGRRRTW